MIGHRQIQESEEKFFKEVYVGDIPVIAVFTHFDKVEDDHEFALMKNHQRLHPNTPIPPDVPINAYALAVRDYDDIYRPNLEKVTGRRSKVAFRRVSMPEGMSYNVPVLWYEETRIMAKLFCQQVTQVGIKEFRSSSAQHLTCSPRTGLYGGSGYPLSNKMLD